MQEQKYSCRSSIERQWLRILAPLLLSCVTLGKSLNISVTQVLICKIRIIILNIAS